MRINPNNKWVDRALYGVTALALGYLAHMFVSIENGYNKMHERFEDDRILMNLEEKGAKTCDELYGRVATEASRTAKEACRDIYKRAVLDTRKELKGY